MQTDNNLFNRFNETCIHHTTNVFHSHHDMQTSTPTFTNDFHSTLSSYINTPPLLSDDGTLNSDLEHSLDNNFDSNEDEVCNPVPDSHLQRMLY